MLGVGAAVAGAYALGVATGVVGSGGPVEPPTSFGVLDEAARQIQAQAARPVEAGILQRAAVEGMLRAVGDRWSRYLGPAEFDSFRDALEGRYSGVGLWLSQRRSLVVVSAVQDGTPAALAGVRAGDVVTAVDDEPVSGGSIADVSRLLRGDDGAIRIGARTSVQDGSVLHCTEHLDTVVGDESVVGHMVHLEGCTVEAGALVGNGSVVLHEAVIRTGALVGSNAVVPARMEVPGGAMALGVPAKLRLDAVDPEMISGPMWSYVERIRRYRAELRRID